jgi:flagellar motor switch protein FliN
MASSAPVAAGVRPGPGAAPLGSGPARPVPPGEPVRPGAAQTEPGQALVPSPRQPNEEESEFGFGPLVARLPVELDVGVPVREFRVRHLLALEPGALIESRWNHGIDLPLAAGDVQLAWSEFEVIETKLAVRVTRLA